MLPVRSPYGAVIAFIGRAATHAGRSVPKYLNSPGTGLYDKGEVLFGLHEGRGTLVLGACPVIVEGPFDAIAVTAACPGRHVGVAPCGTALTVRQVAALSHAGELSATGVRVAFDQDGAGCRAALRSYHLLSPLTADIGTVMLPEGSDPAQILADRGPAALAGMLASRTRPLADLVMTRCASGDGGCATQKGRSARCAPLLRSSPPCLPLMSPARSPASQAGSASTTQPSPAPSLTRSPRSSQPRLRISAHRSGRSASDPGSAPVAGEGRDSARRLGPCRLAPQQAFHVDADAAALQPAAAHNCPLGASRGAHRAAGAPGEHRNGESERELNVLEVVPPGGEGTVAAGADLPAAIDVGGLGEGGESVAAGLRAGDRVGR